MFPQCGEDWVIVRSGDADGNDGSGISAFEEGINNFQHDGFHSSGRIREVLFKRQRAVQIDCVMDDVIGALELR